MKIEPYVLTLSFIALAFWLGRWGGYWKGRAETLQRERDFLNARHAELTRRMAGGAR